MTVDVQATFAATLVDEWARAGVTDAVVCPGSRSTPLALALADDGRIRVSVFLDERAGAFFALGLGAATGRPAVVVTTSGTAAAELHPAVVEASHAGVPLITATADRPPELRDVGAPQTIDQTHLFGRAVRWFVDPGVADEASAPVWRSLAARVVLEAKQGPVHVNLPFRDPLVGRPGPLPAGRDGDRPWHGHVTDDRAVARPPLRLPARGVVVAGRGAPPEALAVAEQAGWPLLADHLSGLRVPHANVVAAFDAILRSREFEPAAVLRFGAPPASKVLAQWCGAAGAEQYQVRLRDGRWPDPERTAGTVLDAPPAVEVDVDPEWLREWASAEAAAQAAIDGVLAATEGPTEPGIARDVVAVVPEGGWLVVSSSMPVRDVEWYGRPRTGVRVHANRGANGIDGVVSTALGVAAAGAPTVALLGDLAFLHDAGALLWARDRRVDCTLVVVDNDGGGIFSFLPQAGALDRGRFERLFGTPHGIDLAAVAAAYGVPVSSSMGAVAAPDGVQVVHLRTDRGANVAVHHRIHEAVAGACAT